MTNTTTEPCTFADFFQEVARWKMSMEQWSTKYRRMRDGANIRPQGAIVTLPRYLATDGSVWEFQGSQWSSLTRSSGKSFAPFIATAHPDVHVVPIGDGPFSELRGSGGATLHLIAISYEHDEAWEIP